MASSISSKPANSIVVAYFRSGWAFLIPYLATYLAYAWLGLPTQSPLAHEQTFTPPPLLHVYWGLHALHLTLAGYAAIGWLLRIRNPAESSISAGTSLCPLAPWALLAFIFYIPGIYIEWPSDPWEHLRRINEWHDLTQVTAHSAWTKSSYFLPYSLTGITTGLTQLSWSNIDYTGVCMLLSWQYYRLARAVGLNERASMLFVILQALLFGNNIFSFYRYYGLSSSIFAQLGAVAFTRIALETLSVSKAGPKTTDQRPPYWSAPVFSLSSLVLSALCLTALTALNHIQGLGIAGLGVLAVIIWRLIAWKRAMIGWLAIAAILTSVATLLWLPRHPAIDEVYRTEGWLTTWYGFNLSPPSAPAFDRSLQILGTFGLLNLALGIWLILRRNHVVGWLTVMPVLILLLPCFALPFANALASRISSYDNIVAFHRILFAVPTGLALVATFALHHHTNSLRLHRNSALIGCALLCMGLVSVVAMPPRVSAFNRFWHSVQTTADDLQLTEYVGLWTPAHLTLAADDDTMTIDAPLADKIRETFSPGFQQAVPRVINEPVITAELEQTLVHRSHPPSAFSSPSGLRQIHPSDLQSDWSVLALTTQEPKSSLPVVNATAKGAAWTALGGDSPETSVTANGSVVISNPTGRASHAFDSRMVAIDQNQRYQLTCTLRQSGFAATNYLAVAWYDKNGHLLESNQSRPEGAGSPIGWSNGTYSYYGLVNESASSEWGVYTISFGHGETAAVPAEAAFLRIGALLNYNATPEATIQLKDVVLWQKQGYALLLRTLPAPHNLSSAYSLSAWLSGHWPPHKVAEEQVGVTELRAATTVPRQ